MSFFRRKKHPQEGEAHAKLSRDNSAARKAAAATPALKPAEKVQYMRCVTRLAIIHALRPLVSTHCAT